MAEGGEQDGENESAAQHVEEKEKNDAKQSGKDGAKSGEHKEKNEYNIYAILYLFQKIWI